MDLHVSDYYWANRTWKEHHTEDCMFQGLDGKVIELTKS